MITISYNEKVILEAIWRHGPAARNDVSEITGLTSSAVTGLAKKLSSRDLIKILVERSGARGQPQKPMVINPTGGYSLGVSFTHHKLEAGLIDLSGSIQAYTSIALNEPALDEIVEKTSQTVGALVNEKGISIDECLGIGISVPGDFSAPNARISTYGRFPSLENLDLTAAFGQQFQIPICLENDGISASIGESLHGVAQRFETYIFIHIRHGVKAGVMINGRPFRGANGNAGLIGAYWPAKDGRPRPSGEDLLQSLQKAGHNVVDFDDLANVNPNEVPTLKAWIRRAGGQLSEGIGLMAKLFDPQAIVFGGNLPNHVIQGLISEFQIERYYEPENALPRPLILGSTLGPQAATIGAASVPIFQQFFASSENEKIGPNRFGRRAPANETRDRQTTVSA